MNGNPKTCTTTRRDYRRDYIGRPVCAACGHTRETHGQHICAVMHCYCKQFRA